MLCFSALLMLFKGGTGIRMKDEGWKMKDEGWKMKDERWRMKDEGWKMKDESWYVFPPPATYFNLPYPTLPTQVKVKGWKDADAIPLALNHPLLSSPWLRGGVCRVSLLQCMTCYDILVVMQHTSSLAKASLRGENEPLTTLKSERVKRWKGADATLKGERVVVAF